MQLTCATLSLASGPLNSILPLATHQVHPPKCVQSSVVTIYIYRATHISGAEQVPEVHWC